MTSLDGFRTGSMINKTHLNVIEPIEQPNKFTDDDKMYALKAVINNIDDYLTPCEASIFRLWMTNEYNGAECARQLGCSRMVFCNRIRPIRDKVKRIVLQSIDTHQL